MLSFIFSSFPQIRYIGLVNFGFDERSVAGSMDVHTLQFTGRNYNPIITITLHRRTLQEGKNDE